MTKMARGIRRATMRGASRPAFVPPTVGQPGRYIEFRSTRLWFWRAKQRTKLRNEIQTYLNGFRPSFNPADLNDCPLTMTRCEAIRMQQRRANEEAERFWSEVHA